MDREIVRCDDPKHIKSQFPVRRGGPTQHKQCSNNDYMRSSEMKKKLFKFENHFQIIVTIEQRTEQKYISLPQQRWERKLCHKYRYIMDRHNGSQFATIRINKCFFLAFNTSKLKSFLCYLSTDLYMSSFYSINSIKSTEI